MTENDFDVIAQIRAGDPDAYATLVRRHHAAVLGLCLSMLNNRSGAEDAAQEIFIKAYQSLTKFREDASFSTWIYRIASNHCLDILRRRAREKSDSLEALLEKEGDHAQRLFAAEPAASLSIEDTDLVKQLLSQLSPEYRLVLTLREIQGLSYKEMTKALDCSMDAVKSRLKRARHALEEMARHILTLETSKK